ncbi:hypothetical protein U14_00039 [Candidatus Moduliflexus flocculans]|uniref:Uncharacterized protein n=1 Tax=Candidatus Moduliflexus flocculans TaxID=1499966 RepID=A0A0S6VTE3_9BACT|nr:hypothetical protein U14_00039 [Candidatus Moduliflexus flocculans]
MHGDRAEIASRPPEAAETQFDALQAARFERGLLLRQIDRDNVDIHHVAGIRFPKRMRHDIQFGGLHAADFPDNHLNRPLARADRNALRQDDFLRLDRNLQFRRHRRHLREGRQRKRCV